MKYVLKTNIKDVLDKEHFFKDFGNTNALNSIVTLDITDAMRFEKILSLLNKDKKELNEKGYSLFKIEDVDMNDYEAASKNAVKRMNFEKIFFALGVMEQTNCPLYMVGDGYADEIRNSLTEWGKQLGLSENWYQDYGDEETAFFLGFDILDNENHFYADQS